MTDCFVFPDELPKNSTRCLCVKITNKTSGPNIPQYSKKVKKFYDIAPAVLELLRPVC